MVRIDGEKGLKKDVAESIGPNKPDHEGQALSFMDIISNLLNYKA